MFRDYHKGERSIKQIIKLHAIAALVERGAGISVLPSYLVERRVQAGLIRRLWTPSRVVQNDIWLVYRTADRNDAVISRFVRRLLTGGG